MKKYKTIIIVLILLAIIVVAYLYLSNKNKESSWAPIYRDPKKEMIAMTGMANESNSVAGMIGNPVIGSMKRPGKS